MKNTKLEDIVSLAKRRGFVFQASEIYGGLAGFWDYGPLGVELANNIKQLWWDTFVHQQDNIFGIDGAIIQNPKLWEASGHVAGFTDPLVDCKNCGARHRADQLADTDSTNLDELRELLKNKTCPVCGKKSLSEPKYYNMMMKTWVGPIENDSSVAYLRPETAGSIFTNYDNVRDSMRAKIPFGIAQIGKAFRNEISPRDFIFRTRELEQMELQYFIHPSSQEAEYQRWREAAWSFLVDVLGVSERSIQWHEHDAQGFKELWGTHNRTDFDLANHTKNSKKDLSYFDEETKEKYIPYVIESSVGLGRMLMAVLVDAYSQDEVNGEKRIYLKLKSNVAPVKMAVFPLLKNKPELVKKARQIYERLKKEYKTVMWDDNGNIGKRYRRQDEIGTPKCVTVDFQTLEDDTVTVRDRDTTVQKRIKINDLFIG